MEGEVMSLKNILEQAERLIETNESQANEIVILTKENESLHLKLNMLAALQHGRNYDDDEAEYKLNNLAEEYKKLHNEWLCLKLALMNCNNENEDYWAYDPTEGVEQLESLVSDVTVQIPCGWLQEILEEAK